MKRHASMNRIYRLVWSRVSHSWVAVAENAKGCVKSASGCGLVAIALAMASPLALAAPTGGQIGAGTGAIAQTGATTTITQQSQKLAIDWASFNIATNEVVRFNQPDAASIALNRVLGQDPSRIFGRLSANGQVFILNPNGILFGSTAQVNVGGLVASTLGMTNADFMTGNNSFSNGGTAAAVVNQGDLTAASGGYVALLAPEVRNEGVVTATLGTALLGAGDRVTLNLNNGSLLSYSLDQGALNALADNKHLIRAEGGQVVMTAKAANALGTAVVNNTGIIEAHTVQNQGGVIKLLGDMQVGQVNVGGLLDASAPHDGDGGFVDTSAAHVSVADGAKVTTLAAQGKNGVWLIDPVDYTVASSGGDITGATLGSNLESGNVVITNAVGAGNGDIFVNDAVTWSSSNSLTLNAYRNVDVGASISATNGDIILVAQNGDFINSYGNSGALSSSAGRWLIYTPDATGNTFAGLTGSGSKPNYYNCTYGGACGPTIPGTGNHFVYAYQPTLTITTENAGKTYNRLGADPAFTYAVSGLENGDSEADAVSTAPTLTRAAGKDVGTYAISAASAASDVGYAVSYANTGLLTISPANLAVTGVVVANKVYDTTTTATLINSLHAPTSRITPLSGDTVYLGGIGVGVFVDKNAGTGKAVNVTGYTISGADAGNYTLIQPAGVTANITKRDLALTGVTAADKVYDGTTAATLSGTASITALGSDVVTLGGAGSGAFANKNVGSSKAVTLSGFTIGGADAANYNLALSTSVRASITPLGVTVTGTPVAASRVYNGTLTTTISGATLSGVLGGDTVTLGGSFANKNVGVGKAVTLTTTGLDGSNYSVTPVGGLSADITALALGVTGTPVAASRVYNGTTTTTISGASLSGVLAGDAVTLSGSFADKNVGVGKSVSLALTGASGGNYSITPVGGLTANVTARALTISASGANKVYDSLLTTAVTLTNNRVAGDVLTTAYTSALYLDKNVGTGKTVNVSGITLTGTDAGNYTYNTTATTTGSITKRNLAVTGVTASSKVYNGTTAATLGGTAAISALGGDVVTLGGTGVGVFANKNVGANKAVTVTGYTLGGAGASNYNLVQPAGVTASITQRGLTLTGTPLAASRVYNGTTAATISGASLNGVLGGDTVTLGGTFANKNVGSGKTVTLALSGLSASNYSLTPVGGLTANITALALGMSGTPVAASRVYNGTTTTTISGASLSGVLAGDAVTLSGSFANKNVGVGKSVSLALTGASGGNYSITPVGGLTANVTARALTISASGANKVYNGLLTTAVTLSNNRVAGDVLTTAYTSALYLDKNVGTGKAVNVSGITLAGTDAGNYTYNTTATTTGSITKRSLAVTGVTAAGKVYDGTTTVTLGGTATVAPVAGDVVTLGGAGIGVFTTKTAGANKAVTVTGYTLGGTDAGNYALTQPTGVKASITKLGLTLTGTPVAASRVYDGTRTAAISGASLSGVLGGDTVTLGGTFANKNVGSGKAVTLGLSGVSASNYSIAQVPGLAANVTVRSVTVTAVDKVRSFGVANPALTYTVGGLGLAAGDTLAAVFSGALTTIAGISSPVGTYAITRGTLITRTANYAISPFVNGVLTVQ